MEVLAEQGRRSISLLVTCELHFGQEAAVAEWAISNERGEVERVTKAGCLTPVRMPTGVQVSCRKCANCVTARRNALVGRLLAEQHSALWSGVVTLTYGQSDAYDWARGRELSEWKAFNLTYSDVQIWLKRLRNAMPGSDLRYFVAGEYGAEKGRAHWHCAVFADREPPNVVRDERYLHWAETPEQAVERGSRYKTGKPLWSEGWSYWSDASVDAWAYIAKYIAKSPVEAASERTRGARCFQRIQGWSAKPPLGADWLTGTWARLHVEGGLSPQEPRYEFGDVRWKSKVGGAGKHRRFYMRSESLRRRFLEAFVWQWRKEHGNDNWPWSQIVDDYMEKEELRRMRRRWSLPDTPEFLFNEAFYMKRYDEAGQWLPLLKDGGRSLRETFFRDNYWDLDEPLAADEVEASSTV